MYVAIRKELEDDFRDHSGGGVDGVSGNQHRGTQEEGGG